MKISLKPLSRFRGPLLGARRLFALLTVAALAATGLAAYLTLRAPATIFLAPLALAASPLFILPLLGLPERRYRRRLLRRAGAGRGPTGNEGAFDLPICRRPGSACRIGGRQQVHASAGHRAGSSGHCALHEAGTQNCGLLCRDWGHGGRVSRPPCRTAFSISLGS